tara:strand:+ start:680 stop:913 length:234 start_codon:yes stop_codon:yes gene_type:complete
MATEEVTIPFPQSINEFRRLYEAGAFAVDIKNWLGEQGLELDQDFQWRVDPDAREITFTFKKNTSWASLVALKFLDK